VCIVTKFMVISEYDCNYVFADETFGAIISVAEP
jgi:hypothetical protein